jgi:hypothetical protein
MSVIERRSSAFSGGWRAWRKAGAAERLLAAEALLWLAMARLLVIALPFRIVARFLDRGIRRPRPAPPERISRIVWSLNAISRRAPWRCACLERAIAGAMMLRLRRYPPSVFLGIAPRPAGGALQAHAWLRCGDLPVVGEEVPVGDYAVVARFSAASGGRS